MCNYIHYKVLENNTYPFPNFSRVAVEVLERIIIFTPLFTE